VVLNNVKWVMKDGAVVVDRRRNAASSPGTNPSSSPRINN